MPEFECKLITEDGTVLERVIEAESKFEVYEAIESRNELVLAVKAKRKPLGLDAWFKKQKKVKPREIEHFTTQLSIMLDAGVPLLSSLEALEEQAETPQMKSIVRSLAEKLNSGESFSQALREYPRAFSSLYANMIEAGEKAGVIDTILKRLSKFIGHEIQVVANIKAALRYPIIVFTALTLAFVGAIVFIIPKFSKLFKSQNIELPLPTRILIGLSDAFTHYWFYTLIIVLVVVVGTISFFRTSKGHYVFDLIKLKLPVLKTLFVKSTVARFAHMMETLSRGGILIIDAMQTTETTVGNLVIGSHIAKAKEKVAEGVSLADALSESKYFPPMTLKMISIGEQSGALDNMLQNIATQYDEEVDQLIKQLSTMIEPLMTVMMGAFLLLIALGIFLPMWKMYETF
ncbi:MAG: type II secretion system F family protein [Fidelibacterota bacterium]